MRKEKRFEYFQLKFSLMSANEKYEYLLNEIKSAFEISDIKIRQDEKKVEWNYALCATPIQQNAGLILGINWGGNEKKYPVSETMPYGDDIKTYQFMKRSKTYLKNYFNADIEQANFNYSNFCFFRSPKANDLSLKDYNLCASALNNYIDYIQPPWILSLGVTIIDIIKKAKLPVNYKPVEIEGCIKILGYTGKLFEHNYFVLPHPNSRISNTNRDMIWAKVNPKQF